MRFVEGHLDHPQVRELLIAHLLKARAETAEGSAHALDLEGLKAPEISFWTLWDEESERLLSIGAIKQLDRTFYELKSMHTISTDRGKGIGSRMLQHLIAVAKEKGAKRLSLETGSWDYFSPARAMYKKHGFVECNPFGSYVYDPNSVFMSLSLE